jgi:hypothetical protein
MAEGDFGHSLFLIEWGTAEALHGGRLEDEAPEAARRLRAALEKHVARDQLPRRPESGPRR